MELNDTILYSVLGLAFMALGYFSTSGVKSQWIRILDVIVYGPLLLYASSQVEQVWLKVLLIFMGATTMSYNLRNFIHQSGDAKTS